MDVIGDRNHLYVRVLQVAGLSGVAEQGPLFDARPVWNVHLLALLWMVGVHQLLQRRVLQSVESSAVFYGRFSYLFMRCIMGRLFNVTFHVFFSKYLYVLSKINLIFLYFKYVFG